jgi:hypothetical protein
MYSILVLTNKTTKMEKVFDPIHYKKTTREQWQTAYGNLRCGLTLRFRSVSTASSSGSDSALDLNGMVAINASVNRRSVL